jgi:hypothetical protein
LPPRSRSCSFPQSVWRRPFEAKVLHMFRAKEMTLHEWSRFLEVIDQATSTGGDELPALLVRDFVEGEEPLILLAGEHLDRFEPASPGGWMDYPEAVEKNRWIFLAGDRHLVKRLGLKLDAN